LLKAMKFEGDAVAAAVAVVVALAVVALVIVVVLAVKHVNRRHLQRAARAVNIELLPSGPEPETTPPPDPIRIYIGDASTGKIVTDATVWPQTPPTNGVMKTHDTFDIMKVLFIAASKKMKSPSLAANEPKGNLLCIVNGCKKHHNAIVAADFGIEQNVVVWIYIKEKWMEEARLPG
jgi:hypothetical protein